MRCPEQKGEGWIGQNVIVVQILLKTCAAPRFGWGLEQYIAQQLPELADHMLKYL